MAVHNKTLHILSSKLGINEEKVLNKAAEFERLLQTKTVAGSNMTDTSKIAICLDLAANMFGVDLDLKTAIKYSGLKPTMYSNNKKVLENLLELNSNKLSTSVLCLTLQCTGVQELADKILEEYQRQAKVEVDLNLPQYVCMAVYQACRISKIKIPKAKLIEKSRLRPAQWAKLDADWTKFVDENFASVKKKKGRPVKTSTVNDDQKEDLEVKEIKKDEPVESQIEPYADWKKRVLDTAYVQLRELQQSHKPASPRRSPRKTPQKFSPYKSPHKKGGGVRLLFPLDR